MTQKRTPSIGGLLDDAGEITHIQVAVDGRWEDARRVARTEGTDAISTLASILRPRGELAVEVFAADANGCQTFVGMRLRDVGRADATDLLRALLEVVGRDPVGLADVAGWLARRTATPFLAGKPTRVEIGVVDAWLSLGARNISTIVSAGEADVRKTLLDAADGLRASARRVIAVEFAFDAESAHWIGVEIARTTANGVVASESIAAVVDVMMSLRA